MISSIYFIVISPFFKIIFSPKLFPLFHHYLPYFTIISPIFHHYFTNISPIFHHYFTIISELCYHYSITISQFLFIFCIEKFLKGNKYRISPVNKHIQFCLHKRTRINIRINIFAFNISEK